MFTMLFKFHNIFQQSISFNKAFLSIKPYIANRAVLQSLRCFVFTYGGNHTSKLWLISNDNLERSDVIFDPKYILLTEQVFLLPLFTFQDFCEGPCCRVGHPALWSLGQKHKSVLKRHTRLKDMIMVTGEIGIGDVGMKIKYKMGKSGIKRHNRRF